MGALRGASGPPLAVLMIGMAGSGKTTLALQLVARGFVRLSVDEEVFRLHGRHGVDYPEHEYPERERPVVATLRDRLAEHPTRSR